MVFNVSFFVVNSHRPVSDAASRYTWVADISNKEVVATTIQGISVATENLARAISCLYDYWKCVRAEL